MYSPVQLLGLWSDLELYSFLLWRAVSAGSKLPSGWTTRRHTKVIDVEDTADGAARSPVLHLALGRRCWHGVIDGGVDLGKGRLLLHFGRHCGRR